MFGIIEGCAQRRLTGTLGQALSAGLELVAEPGHDAVGLAAMFLLLRAFSSGCGHTTGVEAISNGVPAFKKPKSANAARPCCSWVSSLATRRGRSSR